MAHDPFETLGGLAEATTELLNYGALADFNPGEQAISTELVGFLRPRFPDWDVNGEWDRVEREKKHLRYRNGNEEDFARDIRPDVIVHRIGKKENLLVVELKRQGNNRFDRDIWKLRGMTDHTGRYAYAFGVHLIVNLPAGVVRRCDVYVNAAVDAALTAWLREQLPA